MLWFEAIGKEDIARAGGKGANLGEMARAGLPVPPGFVVPTAAYSAQVAGVEAVVAALFSALRPDDLNALEAACARVRELILAQPVPGDLSQAVLDAYRRLGDDLPVAVRSSATAEDLPTASFAGQQSTYLGVQGGPDLLDKMKLCWASLWEARSVHYRTQHGFAPLGASLAVVVQQLIDAEVAGVLFTANPVNGSRGEMMLNAAWGLGESVVSGIVTPDTWVVDKAALAITDVVPGWKEIRIVRGEGGSHEEPVPPEDQERLCLSEAQVRDLCAMARRVEAHYGVPQDIEWAWSGGRFYLLQTRPITTLK